MDLVAERALGRALAQEAVECLDEAADRVGTNGHRRRRAEDEPVMLVAARGEPMHQRHEVGDVLAHQGSPLAGLHPGFRDLEVGGGLGHGVGRRTQCVDDLPDVEARTEDRGPASGGAVAKDDQRVSTRSRWRSKTRAVGAGRRALSRLSLKIRTMSEAAAETQWQEIRALEPASDELDPVLASVDTLRRAWEEFISTVSDDEFAEARQRSLRRHAIETGIIERLYDVDWGVTQALVAEGLVREVAEREGGIDDDAFETIRAQFDALEFLVRAAREGQPLTVFFIKQLHELITRHQATYEATNELGQVLQMELHHGQWKRHPNWIERRDGSRLSCTPPEHVQSEMERLVELFDQTSDAHALVQAAWLHHRFINIHPFEDGNGRVARALVLLVLLRQNYAPLVVDRNRRDAYLDTLESANEGDLGPLVRLFAQLEIVALRSEIELPARAMRVGEGAIQIAEGVVERLRNVRIGTDEARAVATAGVANDVTARIREELEPQARGLESAFRALDPRSRSTVAVAMPPAEESRWWRIQLVTAAKAANFFTNIGEGAWWVRLRLVVLGQELRYVVATQKVGHGETGVLAITVFAELVPPRQDDEEERGLPVTLFVSTSADSVTLTDGESLDERWPDVCELIERTLAASVTEFSRLLS